MELLHLDDSGPYAAPTLLVMLPGAYSAPQEFVDEGFVRALRQRRMPVDVVIAGARIEHDLEAARTIQQALLPRGAPDQPGYEIAGWNQPADQTGGDYYDWQRMPDGCWLVTKLVFSSSATVYGADAPVPMREDLPTSATNPYGWTKVMQEQILRDVAFSDPTWRIALLRYFNPVGAHASGTIGEDPSDIPNNLMPYLAQVAVGRREKLSVFGGDYPTPDGTGVRDYIHVEDLAAGHIAALTRLDAVDDAVSTWNLGTGHGTSVLELVAAFSRACGHDLPYEIVDRRPGDVAASYADATRAQAELGWRATRTVDDMCVDTWRWQSQNPHGYPDA